MAKEGSVAPKERINIVYKPATGDAKEQIELPLKLLMLGDYTLRADETPVEDRKPVSVDKDNFNDVLKNQDLKLDLNVPNRLSGAEGDEMAVGVKFESIKDFEPDRVARQVPELAQLLDLRDALTALKGPLGNVPAFRKKIQAVLADEGNREKLLKELGVEAKGE
jgi:type VI secretion system protein ImpB